MNFSFAELQQLLFAMPLSSSQVNLLIALSACLTILLAAVGISTTLSRRTVHQGVRRRAESRWPGDQSEEAAPGAAHIRRGFVQLLTSLGKSTTARNPEELSRVRSTLVRAGYRSPDASIVLFGSKFFLAIVLPCLYVAFRPAALRTLPYTYTMLLFVLCALIGFYAPSIWVHIQMRRRQRQILEGFPDALDLMVVCVEAGLGLEAAIHRVGDEMKLSHTALSEE